MPINPILRKKILTLWGFCNFFHTKTWCSLFLKNAFSILILEFQSVSNFMKRFFRLQNHSTLLYSMVEWFLNLHIAHLKMDSGRKSKTKIDSFSLFSVASAQVVFLWNKIWPKPHKVWNFFSLQKVGLSLVTICT